MNNQYRWGILAVLIVIVLVLFWYVSRPAGAPSLSQTSTSTSTSTSDASTSTAAGAATSQNSATQTNAGATNSNQALKPSSASVPFTLAQGDAVMSWSFKGAYAGNAELTDKANVDIQKFTVLLPSGTFPKYDLYISIANQYDLLGDGAKEFDYLNKALVIDSTNSGLAWDNMGNLLSKLGANVSARIAYRNAIKAEPIPQFAQDFYQFLLTKFPSDTADMTEAQKILVPAHNATQ